MAEPYAMTRLDALRQLRREGYAIVEADRYEGLRDEVALLREETCQPAKVLNNLLDVKDVAPSSCCSWHPNLPACIRIPAELSQAVFGARDGEQSGTTAVSSTENNASRRGAS